MTTFELTATRSIVVKEGWGVSVIPIWDNDEGEQIDRIVEIIVNVVKISRETVTEFAGAWCVMDGITYVPVENFKELSDLTTDDTHDLRTRWFATEQEARAHAKSVEDRWNHPQPWESFVCLD